MNLCPLKTYCIFENIKQKKAKQSSYLINEKLINIKDKNNKKKKRNYQVLSQSICLEELEKLSGVKKIVGGTDLKGNIFKQNYFYACIFLIVLLSC